MQIFCWPKNNAEFWKKKIEDNVLRDQRKIQALESQGWKVILVWECELRRTLKNDRLTLLMKQIKQPH